MVGRRAGDKMVATVIGFVIVGALALAGLWDVYAICAEPQRETVSAVLRQWSRAFPPAAVAVGILIGHLFWPATSISPGVPVNGHENA